MEEFFYINEQFLAGKEPLRRANQQLISLPQANRPSQRHPRAALFGLLPPLRRKHSSHGGPLGGQNAAFMV